MEVHKAGVWSDVCLRPELTEAQLAAIRSHLRRETKRFEGKIFGGQQWPPLLIYVWNKYSLGLEIAWFLALFFIWDIILRVWTAWLPLLFPACAAAIVTWTTAAGTHTELAFPSVTIGLLFHSKALAPAANRIITRAVANRADFFIIHAKSSVSIITITILA